MNAELHSAFVWDCNECGRENFVRALEADLRPESAEAAAEMVDGRPVDPHFEALADGEDGVPESVPWVVSRVSVGPRHVTCEYCGRTFPASLPICDDDGEPGEAT